MLNRRTARLADRAQEARYLATQLPGLRRDCVVVFLAVLGYNAVFLVVNTVRGDVGVRDHVAMGLACVLALGLLRCCRTWTSTARLLVVSAVVYSVISLGLAQDRSDTGWVLLSLHSAAVLYLHARLPFTTTAWVAPLWSLASLVAAGRAGVSGMDLVQASAFLFVLNLVGLAAAHRVATQSRLLFAQTEELERLSAQDPVTGLPNRRAWESALAREWDRAARDGTPLGLVLVDVDHFKQLNEGVGHPGGDRALGHVARLLGGVLRRPGDLAARLGGDEFGLLLPGTDDAGAAELAARLLAAARELRAGADADDPASVLTVSLGVHGAHPAAGSSVADAVAAADAALYRAKGGGRDQVGAAG